MGFLDKLLGRGKAIAKEGMEVAETVAGKTAEAAEKVYDEARERLSGSEASDEEGESSGGPSGGGGGAI